MLGSVAENTVRYVVCPMLVIPAGKRAKERIGDGEPD